jgi:ABC-type nitrate/sulfonate/bicarbonate transport system permease component
MRLVERGAGMLVLAFLLVIWEALSRAGAISPDHIPAPSSIGATVIREVLDGELGADVLSTTRRFVVGYLLAAMIGIPLGFAFGRWATLYAALEPIIEFLRPMPVVAVLPIALFVLGLGDNMAYAVIAFGAGWIILLHAMDGIRGVDPVLVDTGRTFRVSGPRLFWTVIVPAAAPHAFTGLRVSLAISLILAVVIELIVGLGGLGAYIGLSQGALRVPETYAGIVLVGTLGYVLGRVFLAIEERLMAWHRGFTGR